MKKILLTTLLIFIGIVLATTLFFSVRQLLAKQEIKREWKDVPTIVPTLQATSQLEIIPLYEEASTSGDFISGHGVSYLIRTDTGTVLMDVGHNPDELPVAPFMQNMQALGISWDEVDRIVISHPHPDHLGGLDAWNKQTISFGELPSDGVGERLVFVPAALNYKNGIHATISTLPLPDVATTGVISYSEVFPLSLRDPKGYEHALVINVSDKGLVLISGCGHPTLERLVERAEELYKLPIIGVVGGLHYEGHTADEVQPHIQFLHSHPMELIALSPHDSSLEAQEAFQVAFPDVYHTLRVGESILFQ